MQIDSQDINCMILFFKPQIHDHKEHIFHFSLLYQHHKHMYELLGKIQFSHLDNQLCMMYVQHQQIMSMINNWQMCRHYMLVINMACNQLLSSQMVRFNVNQFPLDKFWRTTYDVVFVDKDLQLS